MWQTSIALICSRKFFCSLASLNYSTPCPRQGCSRSSFSHSTTHRQVLTPHHPPARTNIYLNLLPHHQDPPSATLPPAHVKAVKKKPFPQSSFSHLTTHQHALRPHHPPARTNILSNYINLLPHQLKPCKNKLVQQYRAKNTAYTSGTKGCKMASCPPYLPPRAPFWYCTPLPHTPSLRSHGETLPSLPAGFRKSDYSHA